MTEALAEQVRAMDRLPEAEQDEIAARLAYELDPPPFTVTPEPERTPGADWPSVIG